MKTKTIEELLDNPDERFSGIARLWSWSSNYDYPSPATVFLDLIGYSMEEFGEPLTTMDKAISVLGYLELGMLAEALDEYSDRPSSALHFVTEILNAEGGE